MGTLSNSESVSNDTELKTVRLLTILPYPSHNNSSSLQPSWDEGPAVLLAAELAVKHINQDRFTLPGYKVELLNSDGGCNIFSRALNSFTRSVLHGPPIAGIIGPGCSRSTIAVSSLTGRKEVALPNVHLGTSPFLENRSKYGNAFGIVSSSFSLAEAAVSLIEHNSWEDVAILYDSNSYVHLNDRLRELINRELEKNRIVFYSVVYDTYYPHDALKQNSAKVIITLTSLPHTLKLLCIAYTRGMVFPRYQWVIIGVSFDQLSSEGKEIVFQYNGVWYTCDPKVILQNNVLLNYRLSVIDKQEKLVSGYTYYETLEQYSQQVAIHNSSPNPASVSPSLWATVTYDAVWALVLAMNMTAATNNSRTLPLNAVKFGNKEYADRVRRNLDSLTFTGMSGPIDFDGATGFTHRDVEIHFVDGTTMTANLTGVISRRNISILAHNSQVFIDTTRTYTYETVHLAVGLLYFFFAIFLCLATVILHVLTTVKRDHPLIKASSPILNHFVFMGCYIWTASAIVYILVLKTISSIDNVTYANSCHAVWVWLIPIGWTLTYGTLTAKTWRVYRIFIHFRDPGRLISNKVLISFVVIQLSFDTILGTVWSIVSPAHTQLQKSDDMMKYVMQRSCAFSGISGEDDLFWIVILYFWKAVQVLALLVLGIMTRSVKSKKFNTLFLRQATFLSFVLFVSILPPFTVLWYSNAEIHSDFVLMCTLMTGTIFIHLIFVLLPPTLPLIKDTCNNKLCNS